jgi:hypothetical protein
MNWMVRYSVNAGENLDAVFFIPHPASKAEIKMSKAVCTG